MAKTVATGGRVCSFSRILRLTQPNRADVIAFVLLIGIAALLVRGAEGVAEPLSRLRVEPVTLDPRYLPYYALRTVIRMFAALAASLVFTLVVATLAARSRRAGQIIVPMLDILQSVPILGFLTFTVTAFMGLFPGQILGVELAAVFAIFTSQAWNMAFSFYQSLRSVPSDLDEVTRGFALSPVRRFLRLDLPFATPSLVWNAMMSMSGGWFFVVASEAITVGNTTVTLPGVGSWLALAIARKDFTAIGNSTLAGNAARNCATGWTRAAQRGRRPIQTPIGTQTRLASAISTTTRSIVMQARPNTATASLSRSVAKT